MSVEAVEAFGHGFGVAEREPDGGEECDEVVEVVCGDELACDGGVGDGVFVFVVGDGGEVSHVVVVAEWQADAGGLVAEGEVGGGFADAAGHEFALDLEGPARERGGFGVCVVRAELFAEFGDCGGEFGGEGVGAVSHADDGPAADG